MAKVLVGSFRYHWVRDAQGRKKQELVHVPGPVILEHWLEEWVRGAESASAA